MRIEVVVSLWNPYSHRGKKVLCTVKMSFFLYQNEIHRHCYREAKKRHTRIKTQTQKNKQTKKTQLCQKRTDCECERKESSGERVRTWRKAGWEKGEIFLSEPPGHTLLLLSVYPYLRWKKACNSCDSYTLSMASSIPSARSANKVRRLIWIMMLEMTAKGWGKHK